MSFGSQIFHQPRLFGVVIEASASLGVQLVCSVGDLDLGTLPEHVIAVPYFPQLDLLRRSAAFITHGGANSLMEATTLGVPVLVSPLCNDQFHNAAFVARAGTALASLLTDAAVRARVDAVAASYRSHDGSSAAAERLMRWLT